MTLSVAGPLIRVGLTPWAESRAPLLLTQFDGAVGSEWTAGGTGSITPAISATYVRVGTQTMRIRVLAADAGGKRVDLAGLSLDLSEYGHFYMPMFVRTLTEVRISGAFTLVLCSDTSGFTNYYTITFDSNRHGYNVNCLSRSDFTSSGSPSWSDIRQLRLTVNKKTTDQDVYFDALYAGGWQTPIANVVFTFDDGWDTQYSIAYPYLETNSVPCSYFIIGSLLGDANYMTAANVATLLTSENTHIGLHGEDRWDNAGTAAQIGAAMIADKASIAAAIGSSASGINLALAAWPTGAFGYTDDNLDDCLAGAEIAGVTTARATGRSLWSNAARNNEDRLYVNGCILGDSIDLATAKALVDKAILNRATLVFSGHKLGAVADSLTWVTADFQALVDYVVVKRGAGLCSTVNFAQFAAATF